jgi:hypothetical protein
LLTDFVCLYTYGFWLSLCSGYRIVFSSPCFMILLANICSIILQQTDVKDIGL